MNDWEPIIVTFHRPDFQIDVEYTAFYDLHLSINYYCTYLSWIALCRLPSCDRGTHVISTSIHPPIHHPLLCM